MEMLTYSDVATLLGIPKGTVYAMVHAGAIPHVRLGPRLVRFERTAVLAWLEEHRVTARTTLAAS